MGLENKITALVSDIAERVAHVKRELQVLLAALPDNPRAKRLGPNCFVMCWKDLTTHDIKHTPVYDPNTHKQIGWSEGRKVPRSDWSVECYDFQSQYRVLIAEVENRQIDTVLPMLTEVVQRGKLRVYGPGRDGTVTFHPDVRTMVGRLIGVNPYDAPHIKEFLQETLGIPLFAQNECTKKLEKRRR